MTFSTIISAAELVRQINNPQWVVIDCRHDLANPDAGRRAYDVGHVPGARFAHLDADLSDKRPGPNGEFRGRHPLPDRDAFVDTMRAFGINNDSQVVAYDAQGGMFAARLWWMLRWIGHSATAVLDGGLPAWTEAGGSLSTSGPAAIRGDIDARPALVTEVGIAEILENLAHPRSIVIDARAPDRFRGENETLDPVGGHIPGARNRFFKDNLQADQRFKPADQLRSEFERLIDAQQATIMQCGSGVTSCHNILAMEIAGLPNAALYAGSWSEWCADPARPVATGN